MNIEWVETKKLKPNPKNRNEHSADQVDRLAQIIKYQGWRFPIVADKENVVWAGHGRLLAAKKLKEKTVPVSYQEFTSPEQAYAFLVSDNAIASWAELDLSGINSDIGDLGPDFDIDLLGIKDFILEPAEKLEPGCNEDDVPEAKEPITRPGDLYHLGDHRLLCGDSTDILQVEKLMGGEKADMVFTDPPYNIAEKCKGIASQAPTNKQSQKLMDSEWDKGFKFKSVAASIYAALAPDCTVYVTTSQFVAPEIWQWMDTYFDYSGYCVWAKPNPFPSLMKRRWAFSTELVCYATKGKQVFNYPGSGNALSVWTIPIGEGGLHPTQKPVKVSEHAIIHSSSRGQSVLDLFGGSGSTLIACEKTNRRCFMMELDPHYCDVIVARWEKYTGKKAELING